MKAPNLTHRWCSGEYPVGPGRSPPEPGGVTHVGRGLDGGQIRASVLRGLC